MMDEVFKQALRDNHQELRSAIIVTNILPSFRPYLTDVEYSQVQGQTGNVAQVDELVRILLTKENKHFDVLCRVCRRCGYSYWARRLNEAAGVPEQEAEEFHEGNVMKEKKMLYYPIIESLHDNFYSGVIIPFEAFVMNLTDADFQRLKRMCEQVIRRKEHPISCKVRLPAQREQFLDDLHHEHDFWKNALEYQLLREVIREFQDESLTERLMKYEALLREKGDTVLVQCDHEYQRCPHLYLELKANHNSALSTLFQLKSFLINDIGLKDASFAGFREGCIELIFKISAVSASTALEPLCSHDLQSKLLSMGVRTVTLSGHWMINTETGHVTSLKCYQRPVEDHDVANDHEEDSIADGKTQFSDVTASIVTNSGTPSDLEEVPLLCKRVSLNPEEIEGLVLYS